MPGARGRAARRRQLQEAARHDEGRHGLDSGLGSRCSRISSRTWRAGVRRRAVDGAPGGHRRHPARYANGCDPSHEPGRQRDHLRGRSASPTARSWSSRVSASRSQPGEIMALIGPSGSGKTTALRAVAGFVRPTSGRIRIGERDVTDLPPYARNIGMVVQNYALFPHHAGQRQRGLRPTRPPRAGGADQGAGDGVPAHGRHAGLHAVAIRAS